jgi:hypothetical protein
MPDIAMCEGGKCTAKHLCYRYVAEPSYYQSYFANPPFKDNKCEFFWGEQSVKFWEDITKKNNELKLPNQKKETYAKNSNATID